MSERSNPLRLLSAFVLVAVILAACGEQASPMPSESTSPTLSDGPSATAVATATAQPTATPDATPATYVVQAGDTLSSIGRQFGATVAQLQAWNAERYPSLLSAPDQLEAGWELIVGGEPDATPAATPQPTLPPSTPRATPLPTPAPTPSPATSGCHANTKPGPGAAQTFYRVPGAGSAMALTFDMGGRLDPGKDILNFLIDHHICATLFPTGAMAQTSQGQQIMAIVRAHPELFEIGNHTMHHCDLVRGGGGSPTTAPCAGVTPTAAFIQKELTDAAAILRDLSGQSPKPYWRPPYGSINASALQAAAAIGYTKTFMWDIDTIDWKPISDGGPTAQQIATKVVTQAQSGSVVLMHLGGYETQDALRLMVPGLRDRGLLLTSLSDLLD